MHEEIGLNFAAALRSFLRQDPDIIMVGEIRDFETAEIAVKAALTGHLVLSTLHTNDAPATVSRLLNMGIEPFLVTASVNLIAGPAPRAPDLRRLQGAGHRGHRAGAARRGHARERGARDDRSMKGRGCRTVHEHRLQGPRRALRGDARSATSSRSSCCKAPPPTELKREAIRRGMRRCA